MKRAFLLVITLLASLNTYGACKVGSPSWQDLHHLKHSSTNFNMFYKYGMIHEDANTTGCEEAAADALFWQLNYYSTTEFTSGYENNIRLGGFHVALVYAAANRLAERGYMSRNLHDMITAKVRAVYVPYAQKVSAYCGTPFVDQGTSHFGNTCMEDYTGNAAGYAWMAFYYRQQGFASDAASYASQAESYMKKALDVNDGVCIDKNPDDTILCDGSFADLPSAKSLSLNHQQQHIGYGFGQMANIASAALALEEAGYASNSRNVLGVEPYKSVAKALFREAQEKATSSGSNFLYQQCIKINAPSTVVQNGADCAKDGSGEFHPTRFGLRDFYSNALSQAPPLGTGYYNFDSTSGSYGPTGRFSYGDKAFQYWHGYRWWKNNEYYRPVFMPEDNEDPIGYLDNITPSGVASGWACDPDPWDEQKYHDWKSITVAFYADYPYWHYATRLIKTATVNLGSESAVNNLCGGGSAHRFSVTLPSSYQGRLIYAAAVDYTGLGRGDIDAYSCPDAPACKF